MYATCNLVPAAKPRYNHTVSPLHAKYFFVLSNFKTSSDDRHIAGFPFSSRLYLWVDKGNLFLCFETLFYGGEGGKGKRLNSPPAAATQSRATLSQATAHLEEANEMQY
jgi:hypothetical protein